MKNAQFRNLVCFLLFSIITVINVIASDKPSKLNQAIMDSKVEKVKQLIDKGVDVNEPYGRFSPLERAAADGNLEIVKLLLSVNAASKEKAFDEATSNTKDDVIKYFIDNNIIENPNTHISYFYQYFRDNTKSLNDKIERLQKITNGKLNSPYLLTFVEAKDYQQVIDSFSIKITNKVDALGNTILHIAAKQHNVDLVNYLLEHKFDINSLNNNNQTSLYYAITCYGPSIDFNNPVIEDDSIAKINFVSDMPYYNNPQEIQQEQVAVVMTLLDKGIKINQQDKFGWSVLHYAAAFYPEGLQELLISKGANKELKTKYNRTPSDILALKK